MLAHLARLFFSCFIFRFVLAAQVTHFARDLVSPAFTPKTLNTPGCEYVDYIASFQEGNSVSDSFKGTAVDVYLLPDIRGATYGISIDGVVVSTGSSLDGRGWNCLPLVWSSSELGKELEDSLHTVTITHNGRDMNDKLPYLRGLGLLKLIWTINESNITSTAVSSSTFPTSTEELPQSAVITASTHEQTTSSASTPAPVGAVAGGVVGGLFGVSVIIWVVVFMRRRSSNKKGEQLHSEDGSQVDMNTIPTPYTSIAQDHFARNPPAAPLSSGWMEIDFSLPTHYSTGPQLSYAPQRAPSRPPPPFSTPAFPDGRLSRHDLDIISRLVAQECPPASLATIVDSMTARNNWSAMHGSVMSVTEIDAGYRLHSPNPPTYDFKDKTG